jgi:hypothetical protein
VGETGRAVKKKRKNEAWSLVERNKLIGDEMVGAAKEHLAAKIFHQGLCLKMEIAQHFIRSPAAQKLDVAAVNVGAQESGRACCT